MTQEYIVLAWIKLVLRIVWSNVGLKYVTE